MFKFINIFKKEKRKYGGLIEALGLSDFWDPLSAAKKYELAEKLLKEAEKRTALEEKDPDKSNNNADYEKIIDRHFTYNQYIELYYKQRDKGPEYLEKCIEYCKKDIELFPKFKEAWIKCEVTKEEKAAGYTFNLRIPSFERLAIIYEKQGKIDEAIEICKKAIEYGLHDRTKGGFQGRLNRLYKKQTKNSSKEE